MLNLTKLRDMSVEQLRKEETTLRTKIWKLRVDTQIGQNQDANKIKIARRDLARVMTIIREQEIKAGGKA